MSDGPYRSLPMSRGWKQLAKFAENVNFDRADISAAASHALKTTWTKEVPAIVVKGLRDVFLEKEPGLFVDTRLARVEAVVANTAGYGLGRLLTAHASSVLAEGLTGEAGLLEAAKRTLESYGARSVRQIEEHYCRKAPVSLTAQVRTRISEAIGSADFVTIARQGAGLEPRTGRGRSVRKHVDIDAGVELS
ncbi:hypothetical protein BH11PSE13_BH11PSE13_35600 [soil metagenome]